MSLCPTYIDHSVGIFIVSLWQSASSKVFILVFNITNRNTSSRFRFEALLLRPVVSSRKLGEYRLSILLPPVIVACITPGWAREGRQLLINKSWVRFSRMASISFLCRTFILPKESTSSILTTQFNQ